MQALQALLVCKFFEGLSVLKGVVLLLLSSLMGNLFGRYK